jgi:membrane protease YdiL (CAAX protease family)
MKTKTKLFFVLWFMAIIASIIILPYIFTVQGEMLTAAGVSLQVLAIISIIQGGVVFGISAFIGLILAEKVGFKLPLLTAILEKKKIQYLDTLKLSIILGLIAGILIIVLDIFVFKQIVSIKAPWWQGLLASFYGGIAEEILMRLFLVSLIVFILVKVCKRKEPNNSIVWFAIILISVIFGLGHLPITSTVVSITEIVIIRAIVLNGVGGIIFGWLYWKRGLESAIIAHFCGDIIIHVIFPLLS